MCGIVGVVGKREATPVLMEGLKRLEYRGYDSAGIATIGHGHLAFRKTPGKLEALEKALREKPLRGTTGIGHTRWATHGRPTTGNAHPHVTSEVAVVHNGIIENYKKLRSELEEFQVRFASDTDTEVVPQLITFYMRHGMPTVEAVKQTLRRLEGSFAIGIIFKGTENYLIASRRGSPLVIGYGEGENYIGSDAFALAPFTSRMCYLEDGDWAEITHRGAAIYNHKNDNVERPERKSYLSADVTGKGSYRHYMLKEIHEQPASVSQTLEKYIDTAQHCITLPKMGINLRKIRQLCLVGCGTSHYAGMVGRYWLEALTHIPVSVDIASEFRYRKSVLPENSLSLFLSQSGETADTLAALHFARAQQRPTASIVNAPESSMALLSDSVLHTFAGTEIGVASTKAFTTQLAVLACFSVALASAAGMLAPRQEADLCAMLLSAPAPMRQMLAQDDVFITVAAAIKDAPNALYIGRGITYPLALEGALKLKELSYIHAEGLAAGELKHGPIALVDEKTPVIALAPSNILFEKTASNIREIATRGGKIILIGDDESITALKDIAAHVVRMPKVHPLLVPLLYALPVQLIAYHVALARGTDIDQPRNLAKSVTVE